MLLALALLTAQPATVPASAIAPMDAMALKSLLSERERLQVVGATIHRVFVPGTVYQVNWWTAARLSGGFCERQLFGRELAARDEAAERDGIYKVEEQPPRVQFALAPAEGCDAMLGWASPLPGQIAVSLTAMELFAEVRQGASTSGRPPFTLTCRDEVDTASICERPNQTLALLPLGAMGTPRIEAQSYRQDSPNVRTALPPRSGEPIVAVIPFRPAGDPRTTFVTLRIEGGKVVAVDLARTTVIYH